MKYSPDAMEDQEIVHFYGGEGSTIAKMAVEDGVRIIVRGRLSPGSSIGLHTHTDSLEVIFILSGHGKVLFEDGEERLGPGDCHYCPKGCRHSLINDGDEDLVFSAVVPKLG